MYTNSNYTKEPEPPDPTIMTPEHPRWREFCDTLGGPTACDFSENGTWRCKGGNNKPFAIRILKEMGANVEGSLKFFKDHGGHCDCEILFNVDRES